MPYVPTDMIIEESATADDIFAITQQLDVLLTGVPRHHAIISLLVTAMKLIHPDIAPDDIRDGVKGISDWICLFLADRTSSSTHPLTIN